ncbi:MAG: hypothetical protein H8D56_01970 [Planctomycetes bacterium]|nr:hypothetical protein [Planctomycetota bacterium]MBL7145148.1 hypothetical protein [Phycisphaerae bacterium]
MKEQDKKMIGNIVVMAVCLIMLVFGTFWKKIGLEGKGIFLIMCSLYLAMWLQAGIVRDDIKAKLEEIKEEISKGCAVEKSASTNKEQ